ncbi:LLM class flavin-dependent oxidoreductase, partial [Nonomuraea fuscirosea]
MTLGLAVPFVDPAALVAWARRADAGPYVRIGVPDRIVYDNPETVVMLAAMAAVTERIRVQSEVVLAPLRDPVLLAKQSATLDRLSGGRFTLGLAVGAREDDFQAVGADYAGRGRRMDEQLATMRHIWAGEPVVDGVGPVGPAPISTGGPELLGEFLAEPDDQLDGVGVDRVWRGAWPARL